ncbi:MAG TPA: hypothetical protein VHY32_02845 [Caulobacteraceae bacterium]|nr:hypothetical protein [Caulobacteraceae bacterium]
MLRRAPFRRSCVLAVHPGGARAPTPAVRRHGDATIADRFGPTLMLLTTAMLGGA